MKKAFLLALALLAACADQPSDPFGHGPAVALLPGPEWTLVGVRVEDGAPIRVDVRFTARFEDQYVGGIAGPNAYGGEFEADDEGMLAVSDLVSTLIGGPEAEKGIELLRLLGRAYAFEAGPNELRIYATGDVVLRFERS